ncbi:hypothetical protein NQ317_003178 [Molorchus minor]|uniref:Uncharacterized protein n=1 Tax=Molorchus minor TaxID=1323400 RepID=A0ABQ9JA45_9CUCU|nr:hypothetical protein NQ317_003178 [Molorchus minor]
MAHVYANKEFVDILLMYGNLSGRRRASGFKLRKTEPLIGPDYTIFKCRKPHLIPRCRCRKSTSDLTDMTDDLANTTMTSLSRPSSPRRKGSVKGLAYPRLEERIQGFCGVEFVKCFQRGHRTTEFPEHG